METLTLLADNSVDNYSSVWGSHTKFIYILWYPHLNVKIFSQPTALRRTLPANGVQLVPDQTG